MNRWVINIGTSYARFALAILAVFFLTPHIVASIGIAQFGIWALVLAVTGMLGLLDFGLATAAVKFVAESTGANDTEGRNRVLSTLLTYYLAIGFLTLAIVFTVIHWGTGWITETTVVGHNDGNQLALLIGITVALGLLVSLFRAALAGAGLMHISNCVEMAMTLSYAFLAVTTLSLDLGVRGLAIALAASTLLGLIGLVCMSFRHLKGLRLRLRFTDWQFAKSLLTFSGWAFLANAAVLLILRIDPLIIDSFLPLAAVASYAVAARIAEYALLINKQFSNALMPLLSQAHGRGSHETVQAVLVNGSRYLLAVAVPLLALLGFYASDLLVFWLGEEFSNVALALRLLVIAVACTVLQLNAANVLGMTGRHRFVASAMAVSAALNVGLTIWLIPSFGLTGAAAATLIASASVEMGVILPAACRHAQVSLLTFSRRALLPCVAPLALTVALVAVSEAWIPSSSLVSVLVRCTIGALAYLTLFFFLSLTAQEREFCVSQLTRISPWPAAAERGIA